jgi:2-polyprenyl-6-methoxyphenol hydroxylase-like FAD-dependent oxidoreductase
MVSFEQDADGVTAVIRDRDSNSTSTVRARYMVAADGARSPVRERLQIQMKGHGTFSKNITIYFRANVEPLMRNRNLTVIYVFNPVLRGFFRIEKPFQSGFLVVTIVNDSGPPLTDVSTGLTEQRCLELVRAAFGRDDIPVTIENVMHWDSAADVAEHFRAGRILIAGDAAHVMPPNGGFGGNTGVQDAHNLAWKLALVLKAAAGPGCFRRTNRRGARHPHSLWSRRIPVMSCAWRLISPPMSTSRLRTISTSRWDTSTTQRP